MTSDIIRYDTPSPDEYKMLQSQATDMVQSGFLPRAIDTPQKAMAIMLKGRELRLPPWVALSNIHIIEGKPTLSADLMAALVQRAIDQKGDGELTSVPPTETEATVRYRRWGQKQVQEYTFSMKDAQAAGLTGRGPWKAHPKSMMRARALAHACRAGFPDVVAGMYDPDELQQENAEPVRRMAITIPTDPNQRVVPDIQDADITYSVRATLVDDKPANTDLKQAKQDLWDRAADVFGDFTTDEQTGEIKLTKKGSDDTRAAIEAILLAECGIEDTRSVTLDCLDTLMDILKSPESARTYVQVLLDQADHAKDTTDFPDLTEWQETIKETPVQRWSTIWDDAFSSVAHTETLIMAAPSVGALKMIQGQAKKRKLLTPQLAAFITGQIGSFEQEG